MQRLIALLVLLGATAVSAQPVPPGGLRKVTHDATLTGAGTIASALGLAPCGASGETWIWNGSAFACGTAGSSGVTDVDTLAPLQGGPITTTGTVSLSLCSANQVLKMNVGGTAWACAADSGGISNSAAANVIMKSDGTNAVASSATDNGTTWAINTNKVTVTESSGNTAIAGTLNADGNTTIGSTTSRNHAVNGRVIGNTTGFADGLAWTNTASAATYSLFGLEGLATGTVDTTASTRNAVGAMGTANTTRSAGSNALTNIGVEGSASGAQLNYSFYGAAGDLFNAGNAQISGNTTLGDASTDTITFNAKSATALDLNSHQIHNVTDGTSAQDAVTKAQLDAATTGANQVTGTLTSGMIPVATGANTVGDSSIKDDGTSVKINTNKLVITESTGSAVSSGFFQGNGGIYAGSNSQVYLTKGTGKEGLGCFFATNGTATCKINPVGYAEGQTQFRDLDIEDGKGNSAVYVTGSTLGTEFKGAVTADTTLGVTGVLTASDKLHVVASSTFDGDVQIGASGHTIYTDGTNRPTIASCGTTPPTVVGTDTSGHFTTASGITTSCAITFHAAYSSNLGCFAWTSDGTGAQALVPKLTVATGSLTFAGAGGAALATGLTVHWQCGDH